MTGVDMSGVAVVTLVRGRAAHLRQQHRFLAAGSRRPDVYVVVAMDDPTVAAWRPGDPAPTVVPVPVGPAGLPLARARNAGVARAAELGADVVILLDVDCVPGADLVRRYADLVTADPQVVWSGPVTYLDADQRVDRLPGPDALTGWSRPHPARADVAAGRATLDWRLFWSLSFAAHVDTWRGVGGFCEDYVGYGGEDTDFARTAAARGVGLGWCPDAQAYHQYHPTTTPPVQHLADIVANANRFHRRWGEFCMPGWLAEFERSGWVELAGDRWRLTGTRPGTRPEPIQEVGA